MEVLEDWTEVNLYGGSLEFFKIPVRLRKKINSAFPFERGVPLKMEIRGDEIVIRRP